MRKALFVAFAAALVAASPASAGRLSPGLEKMIAGKPGGEEIKVLVVLKDQAPISALSEDLHAAKASMAVRHSAVVSALREVATRSQAPLLRDLSGLRASGTVRGYTPYWIINAVVVATTVDGARQLAARMDVDVVEPDLQVELIEPVQSDPAKSGSRSELRAIGITPGVRAIQADRVWYELGINGAGALVANMDTGVDGAHPALSSRWRGLSAPASECWRDAVGFGDATPVDRHYHGTHVMGTITGLAPNDTIGVAPGALWIANNTINQGTGSAFDNDVIDGLQWFADPDGNPNTTADVPDVVQHSWGVNEGFSGYFDCDSRWWAALDNCEAAGVVNTWSAGNEGSGAMTLRSPADRATTPYNSFSVGATIPTAPYTIAGFSSRGPSGCGGVYAMKPEVSAPGVDIYSAQPGGGYQLLSGTSMAGPHVAGVVALMRAANPDLDVETVKQVLMDTATDLGTAGEDNTYGHGFINAYDAVLAVLEGYGWIEGDVTQSGSGTPIANADVDVLSDPRATTTDGSGHYRIALPAGSYTLSYSAFGYLTDTQAVNVTADQTSNGNFAMTLAPQAIVSGIVRDYTNALVSGAEISVLGTPITPVLSQPNGSYSISVPDGATYDFSARKNGFGSDVHTIAVSGAETQDFVLPELVYEDFESGDFSLWPWAMSGNAPWTVDAVNVHEGAYAAKSGTITHSQASTMELQLYFLSPDDLTFWYTVSSEAGYDFLRFYLDGVEMGEWAGSVPWTQATYPVSSGSHNLRWTYSKDGSVNTGSDAAWVDLVIFPTIAFPEVAVAPGTLEETLPPDGSGDDALAITNSGGAPLQYTAAVLAAPGPVIAAATDQRATRSLQPIGEQLAKGAEDHRVGTPPVTGSGGPDGFGYRWIDSDAPGGPSYNWVEISGVGTPLSMIDDTYTPPISLGISFPFYGNTYSSVRVSSNGFVSFTAPTPSGAAYYTNDPIPTATQPNDIVCAYWDDLNPADGGTIYTYADAANSRFIIEWNDVPRYQTGGTQRQTFQIILNASGTIVTQYKSVNNVTSCTVGIENVNGSIGLPVVFNAAYLHNNLATLFTTAAAIPWLSVSPESGTVPGFGNQNVTVSYDATGLGEGVYEAIVRVGSNDTDEPTINVPVTLTVSNTTGAELEIGLPTSFELGAPQPNPFAANTTVRFAVPRNGANVAISVFDVGGRKVRTLVSGAQSAGRHTATWDGRDTAGQRVSSGVYFYRMDAGDFSQVRKVTLLK